MSVAFIGWRKAACGQRREQPQESQLQVFTDHKSLCMLMTVRKSTIMRDCDDDLTQNLSQVEMWRLRLLL